MYIMSVVFVQRFEPRDRPLRISIIISINSNNTSVCTHADTSVLFILDAVREKFAIYDDVLYIFLYT